MENNAKIRMLKKLLEDSRKIKNETESDSEFIIWKSQVERSFIKIYGENSVEIRVFRELDFSHGAFWIGGVDYTGDDLRCFRNDMITLKGMIEKYIEEFEENEVIEKETEIKNLTERSYSKVFISHSSKDSKIVEEVIELLESMGLNSTQIFCTSFEGYGIDLGENFLDRIKDELSSDTLVFFILSKDFYNSPVCLCEMGATWVLSKEHIPMIIPPLDFNDIKGVIPGIQGLKITDSLKLNSLKEKIEKLFLISNGSTFSTWERKRDRIVKRIEEIIE